MGEDIRTRPRVSFYVCSISGTFLQVLVTLGKSWQWSLKVDSLMLPRGCGVPSRQSRTLIDLPPRSAATVGVKYLSSSLVINQLKLQKASIYNTR